MSPLSSPHPAPHLIQGFTLIELLIVIAIIGILASMMIPALIAAQQRSYDTGAMSCAKSLSSVQGLAQIDNRTYGQIGSSAGQINTTTDGVNAACRRADIFVKDRSNAATMGSDYIFDVWDKRGNKMFTITSTSFVANASGATPFSSTGAGGSNLP